MCTKDYEGQGKPTSPHPVSTGVRNNLPEEMTSVLTPEGGKLGEGRERNKCKAPSRMEQSIHSHIRGK